MKLIENIINLHYASTFYKTAELRQCGAKIEFYRVKWQPSSFREQNGVQNRVLGAKWNKFWVLGNKGITFESQGVKMRLKSSFRGVAKNKPIFN